MFLSIFFNFGIIYINSLDMWLNSPVRKIKQENKMLHQISKYIKKRPITIKTV